MPRAIDLTSVSPERAALLLQRREAKRREYQRRKDVLLQRAKVWRMSNPEKQSTAAKQWKTSNPERVAKTTHENYLRHRDRYLAKSAQASAELIDSVVKSRFCAGAGLQSKDVPVELIPVIRLSIQIKRELKAKRNAP